MSGIRQAAALLLVREGPLGRELFWVRRSREVALGGGFHALPGGRLDEADRVLAPHPDDLYKIAAIRETFEETGVLFARTESSAETIESERRALLAGERTFAQSLERLGAVLTPEKLLPAGRWLTPPYLPRRFDTRFFVAALPPKSECAVWPGELMDGHWLRPDEALEAWKNADALLHPPALHLVRCLQAQPFPECAEEMNAPPHLDDGVSRRIEFQAGLHLVPLRTPTLPPATHTNCWILGDEQLVVIDPGSPYEEEQARLLSILEEFAAEGRRVREVVLTHEHHDHVGAATFLQKTLEIPIRAHRSTATLLEGRVRVDGFIEDGEFLEAVSPWRWRAVFTPGHARGHLCFFEEKTGALITGDMIAGIGSIVVDPPEGDMSDYVDSLKKLRSLPVRALYPAHGPALPDGAAKIDEYIAHRAAREAQVLAALTQEPLPLSTLVARAYPELPEALHPLAERSLIAILLKLEKDALAGTDEARRWYRREARLEAVS